LTADHPTGRITVPVAWFDPPAKASFEAGAEVVVTGYVRRRFFRSGGATQSRTEVVADTVVPANSRARARKAVERAINVVAEGLGA
jgi:single-strand DNA-binding protein